MSGVKGRTGPPPKRSTQRRRTNSAAKGGIEEAAGADRVTVPRADGKWHPVAKRWFISLRASGQSQFYEPSDWATAYLIAEAMSRELHPQPVVVGRGAEAETVMVEQPPKGASLAAWLKAMTALLVTEGERRRLQIELQRPEPPTEGDGNVSWIEDARGRFGSSA